MKEAPKAWRVDNGTFVGHIMVLREVPGTAVPGKMLASKEEDWLPYAVDLRVVNALKQYSFEEPHLSALFHNGTFIGCVNAPFDDLITHWTAVRHVYDEPAYYDPTHPSMQ